MLLTVKKLIMVIVCILGIVFWIQPVLASEEKVPNVYLHLGGQIGLDVLSSSDIEGVIGEYNIASLGFPIGLLGRIGFRNIIQLEVQELQARHNLNQLGFTGDDGFNNTGLGTVAEIKMKYKENAKIIKFNPVYWNYSERKISGIFFVFGTEDLTYKDNEGDGWSGTGNIYGLEWFIIRRYLSASAGFRYNAINFDTTTIADWRSRNFAAGQYNIYFSVAFGLGY